MKQYFYTSLICFLIAAWAVTGIGCTAIMADTCEIRSVSTAMKFKLYDVPHRLAVGQDHVAIQVLRDGQWKFLNYKNARCFLPTEYVSLQRYLEYLIVRYNTMDAIKGK